MLYIDIRHNYFIPYCDNIEEEFSKLCISDTQTVKALMCAVDGVNYVDQNFFINRFDTKLSVSSLSTGCKAALLVALRPDLIVDLSRCGTNARDAIIHTLHEGHIIVDVPNITIAYDADHSTCDACANGYHFTSIPRLNQYIFNEWPFSPRD